MVLPGLVAVVLLASPQAGDGAKVEIGLVPIVRVTQPPSIDGQADEAWSAAVKRRLERSKGPVPRSGDVQGSFRAAWDDTALYLLVEVLDDRRVRNQVNPWLDDSVEVYVDGDGSRGDAYDDRDDHQYVLAWNDPRVHHPKGPDRPGLRFAQAEWEHGYRMEIALSWSAIGATRRPGDAIGLDVHVNDNDGTGREDKLMWSDAMDLAHGDPRRLGRGTLLPTAWAEPAQAAALTGPAIDLGTQDDTGPPLRLQYHDIRTDAAGMILPWSHDDPARAFDHVVRLVWGFWQRMERCPNGVPYYLQHQVWKPEHDPRGLGGDQISMALSSWNLLHGYLGDPAVVANMRTIADYWLAHGMTGAEGPWPNVPFPYNTDVHSGRYDGDMVAGKGFLQPDKAGAFGAELVDLHKITGAPRYLEAAVGIADTLARNVKAGDADHSPWPFRVHAMTGDVFVSKNGRFDYTTNWTGALRLFDSLVAMGRGRIADYERARRLVGTRSSATASGRGTGPSPRTNRRPTRCRATATPRARPRWS